MDKYFVLSIGEFEQSDHKTMVWCRFRSLMDGLVRGGLLQYILENIQGGVGMGRRLLNVWMVS